MSLTQVTFYIEPGMDSIEMLQLFADTSKFRLANNNSRIKVTLEVLENIEQMKKLFFAQVTELGLHAGYCSAVEKRLFKDQVQQFLCDEPISSIKTKEEMMNLIYSLHQLGANYFDYTFPENEHKPIKINFNKDSIT
jgi:hypothetical protein